jgi:hypothetical protein
MGTKQVYNKQESIVDQCKGNNKIVYENRIHRQQPPIPLVSISYNLSATSTHRDVGWIEFYPAIVWISLAETISWWPDLLRRLSIYLELLFSAAPSLQSRKARILASNHLLPRF